MHRVLNAVSDSVPIDETVGRRAGALLGRANRSDTVDAIVVAEAIRPAEPRYSPAMPAIYALANGERTVTIHAL